MTDHISPKDLMSTLYAGGVENDADWANVDDATLARLREASASGDEAVQTLLTHLAFSKFESVGQASKLYSAIAGIKQMSVTEVFEELPTASLEDLRAAAEAAGYEVEVLV